MKPDYTPLKQLDKPAKVVKVKVRVIQKSEPRQTPPKRSYQRLLLQDDEGTTMRGTIFGDEINTYSAALKKNGEYEISGVNVKAVPDQYRSTGGEYQINFSDKVHIRPLDLSACSDEPQYRHLSEIPQTYTDDDDLIDIIAAVVHVGDIRTITRGNTESTVREIVLADHSCIASRPMKLAAWNEHAVKEYPFYRTWPNSFMVIGVTGLRPIPYQGLTLKTTLSTAFVEKPSGEKADVMRSWVQQNKSLLNNWCAKTISLANADKTPTPIEEILEKRPETLWQDEKFWIKAFLSELSDREINCYVGCGSCGRATTEELGATFTCRFCRSTAAVASFRVSLNTVAADASASIKISAFTTEVELICGMKCEELTALKHNENPEPFSQLLEKLKRKEMLLQIAPTNALTVSNILKWTVRQVEVSAEEP